MNTLRFATLSALLAAPWAAAVAPPPPRLDQSPNTWVKRSPLKGAPPSPQMGYEASLAYDPQARKVIRWGGHNQGGGGEQNAELWTYDPGTSRWELKEPNTSPPGVCCAQQNVFDADRGRFLRFAAFSGNHGWQWFREIHLSNSSVWSYDLAANTWRDARPLPQPRTGPLRCASWDSTFGVAVVFAGEGVSEGTVVYDPYTNTWARTKPKAQPASRSGGNMAYDEARRLHILFGSQFSDDRHTWAYDLRANAWHDKKPARQPPTALNDAVLAYDPANAVVVAVVRAADKYEKSEVQKGHLETWAYDAGANAWTHLKPAREPDGYRNRRRLLTHVPGQNVFLLENLVYPGDRVPGVATEQQVWTYRYAEPKPDPRPVAPAGVRVTTSARGARVEWGASPTPGVTAYEVHRGQGAQPWRAEFVRVARLGGEARSFADAGLKAGEVYSYFVRAVKGGRHRDGGPARAQPRFVEDGVASVVGAREVVLSWAALPAKDVVGYHVERAAVEVLSDDQLKRLKEQCPPGAAPAVGGVQAVGPFTRLTDKPVKGTTFRDTSIDLKRPEKIKGTPVEGPRFRADQIDPKGKPYPFAVFAYRVRAVNALGTEGGPSPYWLTIPSAPQWLFAREDGTSCRLKWAANPEKGLKGYTVYRMDGKRGYPLERLTAAPVKGATFTDDKAGKGTRRYYVVAVDALGQEGVPSAPVWHYRVWRRFYEPFVGEWHQ